MDTGSATLFLYIYQKVFNCFKLWTFWCIIIIISTKISYNVNVYICTNSKIVLEIRVKVTRDNNKVLKIIIHIGYMLQIYICLQIFYT